MRRIIALLVSLLAGSCGGKDAPPASPATQAPPAQAATEYPVPSWAKVAPEQIEAAKAAGVPVAFENSIGMRFVLIPAGTFMMGSQEDEAGRDDDETLHEVMLTRPFYLGETEVTNAQYAMARPHHASGQVGRHRFDGDDQPACGVSWDDATSFARWLTRREANNLYRLPTEAEWERACRAGKGTAYWWGQLILPHHVCYLGTDDYGGWIEDRRGQTVAARSLPANPWGLHEVSGNLWEWCADWYAPYPAASLRDPTGPSEPCGPLCPGGPLCTQTRVLRGGSWADEPRALRCAERECGVPEEQGAGCGFRLACTAGTP